MDAKLCLKWTVIPGILLGITLYVGSAGRGDGGNIASALGSCVGACIFIFLFLLAVSGLESLFHKARRGKSDFIPIDDSQAVAVIGNTVAQIPELYSAAVRNRNCGNYSWCDTFLNSSRNVAQLRAEAWKRTETKFNDEEIKRYFREWFYTKL